MFSLFRPCSSSFLNLSLNSILKLLLFKSKISSNCSSLSPKIILNKIFIVITTAITTETSFIKKIFNSLFFS